LHTDKKFDQAIDFYSKAIDFNPTVAAFYGNRSFAHLKTESYGYALVDASKALDLDKTYIKGYYRRASANMALGKFKLALKDFEAVKRARPRDSDAVSKYTECSKIVKQQAFARAIAVESSKKSVAENMDPDSMVVEVSYSGPRLDGDISEEFMRDVLQYFKDQKKLHKKYAYKVRRQSGVR